jgi:hypothetical protein
MRTMHLCLGIGFINIGLLAQSSLASASDASAEIAIIESGHDSTTLKSKAMRSIYESSLRHSLASLKSSDATALHDLFHSLSTAYSYALTGDYGSRSTYLAGMGQVLSELARRGEQDADEVDGYYESLVIARRFEDARRLRREFKGTAFRDYARLSNGGPIDSGAMAAYAAVSEGDIVLSHVEVPSDGNYVVVVIGCHFAVDAARAIAKNPELLGPMSSGRVFWVFGDSELDQQRLNQWTREFPQFKARIAYDNAGWPGVGFGATPTFHFFKGGNLVRTNEGWGGASDEEELKKALDAIGLRAASGQL